MTEKECPPLTTIHVRENIHFMEAAEAMLREMTKPKKVAELIEVNRIKAVCGDIHKCAVAQYFYNHMNINGINEYLTVDGEQVDYFVAYNYVPGINPYKITWELARTIRLSKVVRKFINKFDDEAYPNLIAPIEEDALL